MVDQNSQNPERRIEKKAFDYQALMVSLATAGSIGCFGFLWNLNVVVTELKGNDIKKKEDIDKIQNSINNLQMDMRDVRERTIRMERPTTLTQ